MFLFVFRRQAQDHASELRMIKLHNVQLQTNLLQVEEMGREAMAELEHQKMLTEKAIANNFEYTSTISEMAKFRGEASRMKVELSASQKRCELLLAQVQSMSQDAEVMNARVAELQSREEEASKRETDARKQSLEMRSNFDGGLNKTDAQSLQAKFNKCVKDLEEAQREASRQRELAEIASLQVQSIGAFKQHGQEELKELRDHCAKLESRGDDELLIGRLQRQLMSTKTSYKAFARKYQVLKNDVRQREIALRLLETKLDQREEASLDVLETHRLEVSSLKKALRNVNSMILNTDDQKVIKATPGLDKVSGEGRKSSTKKTVELVPFGKKLLQMSDKVRVLSDLASKAEAKSTEAEAASHRLGGQVEDLQAEKDLLLQNCRDLEALTKAIPKQNVIAARLVSLSEDVRVNKLTVLQQRRQIHVLKAEKSHLQKIISTMEIDVEDLEQGRILAETKNLLGEATGLGSSTEAVKASLDDNAGGKISMLGPSGGFEDTIAAYRRHRSTLVSLTSPEDADNVAPSRGRNALALSKDSNHDPNQVDELMEKLEQTNQQLAQCRKDESSVRLQLERASGRNSELEGLLKEKEEQLAYCERVFREEGLPSLVGNTNFKKSPAAASPQSYNIMMAEQSKLQEAASATVGSLRAMLDEKNRQLDKYRERIEELQRERKVKSHADKRADELLESLNHTHSRDKGGRRGSGLDKDDMMLQGQHSKLLTQVEQADELLQEKERTIAQLEQKLSAQMNQRERAELRCGAILKEMETMKADLTSLIAQLKASEERCALLTGSQSKQSSIMGRRAAQSPMKATSKAGSDADDRSNAAVGGKDRGSQAADEEMAQKELHEKKYASLQKAIQSKDEKIKSYRDMIVRLKDEFVKSEEEKAVAMLQYASAAGSGGPSGGAAGGISNEEAKELKNQILALRDGLRQAKEDVEKGKRAREKLNQSRQAAEEEVNIHLSMGYLLFNVF
jgi:chromosome segregation ATPase